MNNINIIGNLTRDPEVKQFASGSSVCTFGVAINRRYKDKAGEWRDDPTFVDVKAFGSVAESCSQYLSKGKKVGVNGRLAIDQWEKDGQQISKLYIAVSQVDFLTPEDTKGGGSARGGAVGGKTPSRNSVNRPAPAAPAAEDSEDDEDVPW